MPKFYELYGSDVFDSSPAAMSIRKKALCPFMNAPCDGGGNRHQTKIKLANSELRNHFDSELTSVIPGVCSIEYGKDVWVVCPRRLMGFSSTPAVQLRVNMHLMTHEQESLIQMGLPQGIDLGVWAEVYLQYDEDDISINYHFDFVIAPVHTGLLFEQFLELNGVSTEEEISAFQKSAKTGKYLTGRGASPIAYLPNLASPVIVEVMTASTSGSDHAAGTDIATSFTHAIQGLDHNCPGINKRQVWGRMATQLFAKSALAESWGGKTVWLVQDKLLENIELTTKMSLSTIPNSQSGSINFLSMTYDGVSKGLGALKVAAYSEKEAGIAFSGTNTCSDILLSKIMPDKNQFLKSVLRRPISTLIRL